jgi:hypothetical protein
METAKDKLKKMTAWDMVPELTDGEIDELLEQSALMDAAGLAPDDVGWTPTYDLNAAAASGWRSRPPAPRRWLRSTRQGRAFLRPKCSTIVREWLALTREGVRWRLR